MNNNLYILRENEITKIGRFEVHIDQLERNGDVNPYSYVSVREGVHVLPIIENRVCVLRQYRYSLKSWIYEFPGGAIDEGMSPEEAAFKELSEETGYIADKLIHLCDIYPSPGYTNEIAHLFLAFCSQKRGANLETLEIIESDLYSFQDVDYMIETKKILFGSSLICWNIFKNKYL